MSTTTPTVKKAMLLAAGRGTRMRELTDELPKPMIAVRGKPILQHIVEGLASAGVKEILIVVGYRKEVVTEFFGDGSKFGVRISYVTQVVQDGTGRVVELGTEFAGNDPFILSYREKPKPGEPTSPWYNAGVYTFRPSIFEFTAKLERSPRGEYELTDAIRDLALSGRLVQAYELTGAWADVRDPEVLAELNAGE